MEAVESIDVRNVTGPSVGLVARVAPAVCLIVHHPESGVEHAVGTGALIRTGAGIAVLTAGHVAAFGLTGELVARFNFERAGGETRFMPIVDWRLAIAEQWVDGLDYGLAVVCDTPGQPPPQNLFMPLVMGSSTELEPGAPLYCVHHPGGQPKQFSAGTFVAFADCELRYHVFTDAKSSGAPIVTREGKLVAVHRAELAPGRPCAKLGTAIDAIRRTSPGLATRSSSARRQRAEQLEGRPTA